MPALPMRRAVGFLLGGFVGAALAYGAGFFIPETPYERALTWMVIAAALGSVVGLAVARPRRPRL
jgi:uncharacterized membrane protein YccC